MQDCRRYLAFQRKSQRFKACAIGQSTKGLILVLLNSSQQPHTCIPATMKNVNLPYRETENYGVSGGPNRIGQGIESITAVFMLFLAMREDGFETIMVNCNPETVSTDYNISIDFT